MASESTYKEEYLPDLLPLYYKRIFPHEQFYRWLSYGSDDYMSHREISFTLLGEVYIRFLCFESQDEFTSQLQHKLPVKIDIGAYYDTKPSKHRQQSVLLPKEREVVFDIDMTDYDEIRTCCSGADICKKCWKFMKIACKIIDAAMREDFGYQHLLWVFSGRRGIHCWVCDEQARQLSHDDRSAVAAYLSLIKGGANKHKHVSLPKRNLPTSVKRAIGIIDHYFLEIVEEQDFIGTDERLAKFLLLIDENIRLKYEKILREHHTSVDRWKAFVEHFNAEKRTHANKHLIEEIKLQFAYPRLDENVTKGVSHLLKAPFCVHPKTGKVSVPFAPGAVDKFDPDLVPDISRLCQEINDYDLQTKAQDESVGTPSTRRGGIKDNKKTSLLKPVNIFIQFLRKMDVEKKDNLNGSVAEELY